LIELAASILLASTTLRVINIKKRCDFLKSGTDRL
jgi:hypothetical protein